MPLNFPVYFAITAILFSVSQVWALKRSELFGVDRRVTLDLTLILAFAGLFFARVFHVLYEIPEFYKLHPVHVLYFWEGGFVFYGGFIGSFLSGCFYLSIMQQIHKRLVYMDLYAPILSLGYAVGRVGCFLTGCCYGKYCELPWALSHRHPTQLYFVFWELLVFLSLIFIEQHKKKYFLDEEKKLKEKKVKEKQLEEKKLEKKELQKKWYYQNGMIFYVWLLLHSLGRGLIEQYRDDDRGAIYLLSISTWISILFFCVSLIAILKKGQKIKREINIYR